MFSTSRGFPYSPPSLSWRSGTSRNERLLWSESVISRVSEKRTETRRTPTTGEEDGQGRGWVQSRRREGRKGVHSLQGGMQVYRWRCDHMQWVGKGTSNLRDMVANQKGVKRNKGWFWSLEQHETSTFPALVSCHWWGSITSGMSPLFYPFFLFLFSDPHVVSRCSIITELEDFLLSNWLLCGIIIASLISSSLRQSKIFCTRWSTWRISKHNKRQKEACNESKMERGRRDSICPALATCFHLPFSFFLNRLLLQFSRKIPVKVQRQLLPVMISPSTFSLFSFLPPLQLHKGIWKVFRA